MAQYTSAGFGNGGVNYNDADTKLKKQIAQNGLRLKSDPNYNQSEIQRTLQVIQNRQNQGMDTSAQQKYLTQNLGYKAPSISANASSVSAPQVNQVSAPARSNNMTQYSELMDRMKAIANQSQTPFNYDPNSDPAYQAALQRARSNIDAGNSQAQAEMNRRGILNSTITSDRMGEIASNEMGRVEYETLPQLMQQAYQRYLNDQQQAQQQFANLGSLAQMYQQEDQRGIDNNFAEADRTGYYVPAEAKPIISQILQLKQAAEAKGISAAERAQLSQRADGLRAQLASMGVDPSAYAASISSSQARNNPGIRTLSGQQMDLANRNANLNAAGMYMDATGRVITPQSDWSGYARQAANPNTPLTMAGQQQQFNQNFQRDQFAYQQARDAITDQQWRLKFDEDVRQFGLNYALQKLAQENDQAYRQATLALSQDDNDRAWAQLDYSMSQPKNEAILSPNQFLESIKQQYTVPVYGQDALGKQVQTGTKITTDPTQRNNMFLNVVDAGYSDAQTKQILSALGFSKDEIEKFKKQYAGSESGK